MFESIWNFLTSVPIWELALIFFSKIIEVAIGTMRIILISKGYKKPGSILAFFEVLLWIFVASTVIMGMTDAPLKGIIYALGFAIGVYIGSIIENKVAVGKILIHVISSKETSMDIISVGNEMKFACVDGPEFDGHLVNFDEAMNRNKMYESFESNQYKELCNSLKEASK